MPTTPGTGPRAAGRAAARVGRATRALACALACALGVAVGRPAPAQPAATPGATPVVPSGTAVQLRLLDSVVGVAAARGRAVRAVVIAPVSVGGRLAVATGDTVTGAVTDAGVVRGAGRPYFVALTFDRLRVAGAAPHAVRARVADVPDARETVDTLGRIVGPERPGVLRSRGDWASLLLGAADPLAGAVFFAAFEGEEVERHRRIAYGPGVELTLRLTADLALPAWPAERAPPPVDPAVLRVLEDAPLRAVTARGQQPADVITVALVGTDAEVAEAFGAAGWTEPDRSSVRADYETLARAAAARGFAEQPVSTLELNGEPPRLAFEKVVNSMAKRHHARLWAWRPADGGRTLWLVTATRDDGVLFSRARRTFGHRVDPAIDVERQKVVDDLQSAGSVAARSTLARAAPAGPVLVDDGASPVRTDWQLVVLALAPTTAP